MTLIKKNNIFFFKFYHDNKCFIKINLIIIILIILLIFEVIFYVIMRNTKTDIFKRNFDFDKNFDYVHYKNDFVSKKIIEESEWLMSLDVAYLINGLIRKHKPKNCLEIGVAKGGSSILILNAIKDIPDSRLVSIDLFSEFRNKKVGYLVEQKFPQLMNKWDLFVGDMPHKFLIQLNLKFDFLFLDTAHVSPGEFFNIIESLPFLEENAIVVLHDTVWHLNQIVEKQNNISEAKIMPTQIYIFSALVGEKFLVQHDSLKFENVGVVRLAEKQEKYYLNYFSLLMNLWQYMPTNKHLMEFRKFIRKYYRSKLFLSIFDVSVHYNRLFFKNINGTYKEII